ncbi:hypothetical protein GF326_00970 [Candidatus Bathyarchaeota archaeon]|nr:hypothetical protein [Candidatus Bathyarchaeota archaeon]
MICQVETSICHTYNILLNVKITVNNLSEIREIIGLEEEITIKGLLGEKKVKAKIDTGADRTSVDDDIAAEIGLGPIHKIVKVKSSLSGKSKKRLVVDAEIVIKGEHHKIPVSISERDHMSYELIIGKDILKKCKFLIDPTL